MELFFHKTAFLALGSDGCVVKTANEYMRIYTDKISVPSDIVIGVS